MSNWAGYLIKAVKTNKVFPNEYIAFESYNTTPNQREEIKAYRDDNTRDLYRVTAQGTKSVFDFETRENLHLPQMEEILNFFTSAEESDDHLQRKVELQYWNMEDMMYKTAYFYRPDLKFTIKKLSDTDIIFKPLKIDFVEY